VFPSHIGRIDKQFVWRVHQQKVIIPEFNNKINVIKELLHVKYNFVWYCYCYCYNGNCLFI